MIHPRVLKYPVKTRQRGKKTQKSSIEYKLRRGIIPSYSTDTHNIRIHLARRGASFHL